MNNWKRHGKLYDYCVCVCVCVRERERVSVWPGKPYIMGSKCPLRDGNIRNKSLTFWGHFWSP